jgi:hypothetical protein
VAIGAAKPFVFPDNALSNNVFEDRAEPCDGTANASEGTALADGRTEECAADINGVGAGGPGNTGTTDSTAFSTFVFGDFRPSEPARTPVGVRGS